MTGCSDADATAYCTAAGISSPTDQQAICNFVTREKAASRWGTEVQAYYILSNGSFNAVKYNLANTATFTLTESGTITYSSGMGGGAKPNSGAYLNTHYNPNTDLGSINSMHLSLFSQENINETSTDIGAVALGAYSDIELYNTTMYSTLNRHYVIGSDYLTSALSTTVGWFLSNRTSSTAVEIRQDNTSLATGSVTALLKPNTDVLIGTSNLSNFSTKKFAFASIGAGISNTTDYYNSVNQLLIDLGVK